MNGSSDSRAAKTTDTPTRTPECGGAPAYVVGCRDWTVRARDGLALFARDRWPLAQRADAPGGASTGARDEEEDAPARRADTGRPALLCLPGLARTARDFAGLAQRYAARGHRVVCPDYRGRGRSAYDSAPENYRPETYLEDLRHQLCALQTGPVVVVGTSMGGLMAMAMGAAMPTMVRAAVINDIGPDLPEQGMARILGYIGTDPAFADWDEAVAALERMMPALNPGPGEAAGPEDWRAVAETTYVRGSDGRLHPDWDTRIAEPLRRGQALPDLWPLFGTLRERPVLLIRGGASDILSAATAERMAVRHPGLQRLDLPTKGHAPTLDEPQSLETIDAFLDPLAA